MHHCEAITWKSQRLKETAELVSGGSGSMVLHTYSYPPNSCTRYIVNEMEGD